MSLGSEAMAVQETSTEYELQATKSFVPVGYKQTDLGIIPEDWKAHAVNALIHRDYFTSASIRLMVFANRVEIISPGHLPDSLSVEDIRHGKTNRRNPTLTEHASQILPYRGIGSGIPRALREWPRIELIDDVSGNQFSAVIWRPEAEWVSTPLATPEVTPEVAPEATPSVTPEVARLLAVLTSDMARTEIMIALGLKDEKHFREHYQQTAVNLKLIEMTLPDKPRSPLQKYRLTPAGQTWLQQQNKN